MATRARLESWAKSIAQLLSPGGLFMIHDSHPLLFALDNSGLEVIQDYFSGTEVSYESDASYTPDSNGKVKHQINHIWAHDFQEIINALIDAGLTIKAVGEQKESESWAKSIAQLLSPGGLFMIRDSHPLLFALDNSGLEVIQDYFSGTEVSYESDASYTPDSNGKVKHQINHIWAHDFQEIINALIDAGLTIKAVGEQKESDWKALLFLVYNEKEDSWDLPSYSPKIPLTFSIAAQKL